jgi:hypothetical protein
MPKVSAKQKAIDALQQVVIDNALRVLADPNSTPYTRTRASGTLNGIARRQQREENARKASDKAKRDARAAKDAKDERTELLSRILPDNGRLIRPGQAGYVPPSKVVNCADTWPDLSAINRG